jgi:transcriptional regulator with XRE-family HTH domain
MPDWHMRAMQTNFSVFRERLAEACRARNMSEIKLCSGIGLGGRRAINLSVSGPGARDLYRVCQIADALDVSLDWLTGRSNVMSVMEMPEELESEPPKRKGVYLNPGGDFISDSAFRIDPSCSRIAQ